MVNADTLPWTQNLWQQTNVDTLAQKMQVESDRVQYVESEPHIGLVYPMKK